MLPETLREKRAKPWLDLTYSYLCPDCRIIAEAPADLQCACGLPMLSLSALYARAQENVTPRVSRARVTCSPGGHFAAYLTEYRIQGRTA